MSVVESLGALPPGVMRSRGERWVQTLWFEAFGLLLMGPVFGYFAGTALHASMAVLWVLSLVAMAWAAAYNTLFDRVEWQLAGRLASNRPRALRVLHAIGYEATLALATCPLIVWLTPLGWLDALVAEIGLSLAYAVYGFLFHIGFDRLRPVRDGARRSGSLP